MNILGINLSNNPQSINRIFLGTVISHLKGQLVPFKETDFPMYKAGDREPRDLTTLCSRIKNADKIVFSSPEYNGFFSPFGKNVLDWISTKGTFETFVKQTPLTGKPTLVLTCSPGCLGGCRCIPPLITLLSELGCIVTNTFSTVGGFNADTYDYTNVFSVADSFKGGK